MIVLGILIGLFIAAISMPFIVMLELDSEHLCEKNWSKSVRVYVKIRNFFTD